MLVWPIGTIAVLIEVGDFIHCTANHTLNACPSRPPAYTTRLRPANAKEYGCSPLWCEAYPANLVVLPYIVGNTAILGTLLRHSDQDQ